MNKIVEEFLQKLHCDTESISLYCTLLEYGTLSILELSKKSGIERNKIYRMLQPLLDKGLIESVLDAKRLSLRATSVDRLEHLVIEQENQVRQARELFPAVREFYASLQKVQQPGTKVLFFRGKEGLRQMTWNLLHAKGERLSYFYRTRIEAIGEKFHTEWLEEVNRVQLKTRAIFSDIFLDSIHKRRYWDVKKDSLVSSRYIDTLDFSITHAQDMYNDVVAQYYWEGDDIFGIEIHNKAIAKMQRQLFELLWKTATAYQ